MPHPLIDQIRFTRSELQRALAGLTDDEARRRFTPMNCISWNIGHLAWQEQYYWLWRCQGTLLLPAIAEQFRFGAPASTPELSAVWEAWHTITTAVDPWLDTLTEADMSSLPQGLAEPGGTLIGTLCLRMIYHYWYHLGESMAIRQLLGHTNLPDFVGQMDGVAPYRAS
jgi:hypothetical protein